MVFNSIVFLSFFILFFVVYWSLSNKKVVVQNSFLLLGSYFFYAWTDWRFLFLLIAVSVLNFYLGLKISKETNATYRKIYLNIGLIQGIGGLFFFKYFLPRFTELVNERSLGFFFFESRCVVCH